jgi:sortase (surface protein transpeptidase)
VVVPADESGGYAASTTGSAETASTGSTPVHISIPAIGVDAAVVPVGLVNVTLADGTSVQQWVSPDGPQVGWHSASGRPGEGLNVVMNGHHNIYGAVFANLVNITAGTPITVTTSDGQTYQYIAEEPQLFQETGATLEQRQEHAVLIHPSAFVAEGERLTLVSCWPPTNNTHRVIVVAKLSL